jgi:hypothetical protein
VNNLTRIVALCPNCSHTVFKLVLPYSCNSHFDAPRFAASAQFTEMLVPDFKKTAAKRFRKPQAGDAAAARKVIKHRRVKGQQYAVSVRPRQSGKIEEA